MIASAAKVIDASFSVQEYGKTAKGVRHPSIINGGLQHVGIGEFKSKRFCIWGSARFVKLMKARGVDIS